MTCSEPSALNPKWLRFRPPPTVTAVLDRSSGVVGLLLGTSCRFHWFIFFVVGVGFIVCVNLCYVCKFLEKWKDPASATVLND